MADNRTDAAESATPQVRRHDTEAIALVSFAHASSHFYQLVFPSLLPWLLPAFSLSYTTASLMITVFFVTSALGQFCAGFFVDRAGPRAGLYAGLALLASSSLLLCSATGPAALFASTFLAGLGNSVFHPADYSLINRCISRFYLAQAFAWHSITGNIGWATCPLMMTGLSGIFGWRTAAFCSAAAALAILAALVLRRHVFDEESSCADPAQPAKAEASSSFGFLRVPAVWLCFFFFFFTTAAFGVLKNFTGPIFAATYGLDITAASSALTAYILGSMAGNLTGGYAKPLLKADPDRIVCAAIGFSALVALVLALQVLPGLSSVALMALMGFGTGLAGPSRDIMIRKATIGRLGLAGMGRVYGFTYCGMDVGQSLIPLAFGPLLDAGHFTLALYGVAALQALAILTAASVGNSNRRAA